MKTIIIPIKADTRPVAGRIGAEQQRFIVERNRSSAARVHVTGNRRQRDRASAKRAACRDY